MRDEHDEGWHHAPAPRWTNIDISLTDRARALSCLGDDIPLEVYTGLDSPLMRALVFISVLGQRVSYSEHELHTIPLVFQTLQDPTSENAKAWDSVLVGAGVLHLGDVDRMLPTLRQLLRNMVRRTPRAGRSTKRRVLAGVEKARAAHARARLARFRERHAALEKLIARQERIVAEYDARDRETT